MPKQSQEVGRAKRMAADIRDLGLRYFEANNFNQAIMLWQPLSNDPQVRKALAEAYFRRSLTLAEPERLGDLQAALALRPHDPRLLYQLGLFYHRHNQLEEAAQLYEELARLCSARWEGLARLRALVALEQGDRAAALATAGLSRNDLNFIAMVADVLAGQPPSHTDAGRISLFWQGLGRLAQHDAAGALQLFVQGKPLRISRYQSYYLGVAAFVQGDLQLAVQAWHDAIKRGYDSPWLQHNLAIARMGLLEQLLSANQLEDAAELALIGSQIANPSNQLAEREVAILNLVAQAAAKHADWLSASRYWEAACSIVEGHPRLGSPRPLVHNLALAYEAQEAWFQAAEAWRRLLRMRPRANQNQTASYSAEQWRWVQRRAIDCYKHASAFDEAIQLLRNALKRDPEELDLRYELSEILFANQQHQAAANELQRIIALDRGHMQACLRLGSYSLAIGELGQAETLLLRVVEQQPHDSETRLTLAWLLNQLGQVYETKYHVSESLHFFQQAISFAPDSYHYRIDLARVLLREGANEAARVQINEALRVGFDQLEAYLLAILCWHRVAHEQEIRLIIGRAEQALSDKVRFYLLAGAALLEASTPTIRARDLSELPNRRVPIARVWLQLAHDLLEQAVAQRPNDEQLYATIATLFLRIRADLSLHYMQKALELEPDHAELLMLYGLVLELLGDKKAGRETLLQVSRQAHRHGQHEVAERADYLRYQITHSRLDEAIRVAGMPFDPASIAHSSS
jgi:tetratricopeptide (TPR) repeat protein